MADASAPVEVTETRENTPEPVLERRAPEATSDPRFFTEEDLNKARQQEKEKLYKRLETLQDTVKNLEAESRQRAETEEAKQREIQERQQAQAQEAQAQQESEMSAKELLEKKEAEWQAQLQQVQQQVDQERALREQEARFNELMEARQQIVAQYSDRVAPQFLDFITGSTPEEIQQAAEDMAARTADILAQTQEAVQNRRQQTLTSRVTAPSSGENAGAQQSFTPEDIRNMSMAEYTKNRQALLGKGTDGGKARGIFG